MRSVGAWQREQGGPMRSVSSGSATLFEEVADQAAAPDGEQDGGGLPSHA